MSSEAYNWAEWCKVYEIPDVVGLMLQQGLAEDSAWHNDTCPSVRFGSVDGDSDWLDFRLWIEHPDEDRQENPAPNGRFHMQIDLCEYVVEEDFHTIDEVLDALPRWWAAWEIIKDIYALIEKPDEAAKQYPKIYAAKELVDMNDFMDANMLGNLTDDDCWLRKHCDPEAEPFFSANYLEIIDPAFTIADRWLKTGVMRTSFVQEEALEAEECIVDSGEQPEASTDSSTNGLVIPPAPWTAQHDIRSYLNTDILTDGPYAWAIYDESKRIAKVEEVFISDELQKGIAILLGKAPEMYNALQAIRERFEIAEVSNKGVTAFDAQVMAEFATDILEAIDKEAATADKLRKVQ